MIPFHLVTGFLGSGKTTLLKRILDQYADRKRIAVIQNEFAASGTDGKELELTGADFKLVEVNNGSVFCVCMLGNFAASIGKVIETYQPELIFLEASGMSDPINIIELLQDKLISDKITLSHIFTIVDAVHFEKAVKMLTRTRHQVMIADTVLINKTDLLPAGTTALRSAIGEINPFATIVETRYCELALDPYILNEQSAHPADSADLPHPADPPQPLNQAHPGATTFGQPTGGGRPDVKAVVLRINRRISPDGIRAFISELQLSCPRIKGYVNGTDSNVYMIQSVFDTFEMRQVENYTGPSEIIAFGRELTPAGLRQAFVRHTAEP
ncbi:MAG: GTP-binding protein [Bacteroidales bacterium]|nr:GTP-binding protein [Bacteroidales bacterium]